MAANDPVLVFYRLAIRRMKTLSLDNPLSWRYQAAIHDYPSGTTVEERTIDDGDPFAAAGDTLPTAAEQTRFWRRCQHASWFFLPWHRMYLHCFEKIVLSNVLALGGPADWALPYWNYSASDDARRLPLAFRGATIADGSPNDLHTEERHRDCNAGGNSYADRTDTDLTNTLAETVFSRAGSDPITGFGGPRIENHGGGGASKGAVERVPHDAMHGAIGSPDTASAPPDRQPERLPNGRFFGFMISFVRAPLDPIFWIHHCNVDRIWSQWVRAGGANPTQRTWLDTPFSFHDGAGNPVDFTSSQMVDTRADPLGYVYDDEPM